ncbi:hypothetical protein RGQ29_006209 [Quercus rubra]|uniref:Uncharacterized protein n=1 Tax=Quercus rubra TaxID=3512 RepID=A0AAN7IBX8_QUERU|nr:hypothetical protein RGQ29_006209 [Quercus rubra]
MVTYQLKCYDFEACERFGAMFNMARLLLDDFRNEFEKGPWWQPLFKGYSFTTWLVVLNLGSTGLGFLVNEIC